MSGARVPAWYRREIRAGDSGPDVAVVRRKLALDPRGEFDDTCERLIRGMAKKRGVQTRGEVNEAVAAELGESATAELAPEWFTRTIQLWFEGEDVRALREALAVPGGRGENRYDPDAEKAVRRYQSEHGLPITGLVDEVTARRIGDLA
jgi:murein L,D-transpeptidase YcbB/YkuD